MTHHAKRIGRIVVSAALVAVGIAWHGGQRARAADPVPLRLYVLDCGTIEKSDLTRYRLKPEEVANATLSMGCYLVVHPRGTLIWDTGGVPDSAWKPTGKPIPQHLTLPDGQTRDVTVTTPLLAQLASSGYSPDRITYVAFSHYHWDHTANANAFAHSTWIARAVERDAMLSAQPPAMSQPSTFSALRSAKAKIATGDFDVFGDGTVVMKLAPGHTPGHQVLFLRLPKTGNVVLSGDLYHYPEERRLGRVPAFDVEEAQTRASRAAIDTFLEKEHAQLWIQHDFAGFSKLKKAPAYYE